METQGPSKRPKVASVSSTTTSEGADAGASADDEDDVHVMDPPPIAALLKGTSLEETKNNSDDEVQVVGTLNEQRDLPHMRPHCTRYPYVREEINLLDDDDTGNPSSSAPHSNQQYCNLCYCYVCDVPASECKKWGDHCQASDKDSYWRQKRQSQKHGTFRALFPNAKAVFKRVLRLMSPTRKTYLDCSQDGIRVMSIFPSNESESKVATLYPSLLDNDGFLDWDLVENHHEHLDQRSLLECEEHGEGGILKKFTIPATDFDEYHCAHRFHLRFGRFGSSRFSTALKEAEKGDSLLLQLTDGALEVQVMSMTTGDNEQGTPVKVPIHIAMPQEVNAPQEEQCVCRIRMERRWFKEIVDYFRFDMDMDRVGFECESKSQVIIHGNKKSYMSKGFKIRLGNDEGEGSTMTKVECKDYFHQCFSSRFLGHLLNAAPECSTVEVHIFRDLPCRIDFPLLEGSDFSSGGFSSYLVQCR